MIPKDQRKDCRILVRFLREVQKAEKIAVDKVVSLSCEPDVEMAIRGLILFLPLGPSEKNFPPSIKDLEKVLQKAEAFLAIFDEENKVESKPVEQEIDWTLDPSSDTRYSGEFFECAKVVKQILEERKTSSPENMAVSIVLALAEKCNLVPRK